jgi:hypothetical protein
VTKELNKDVLALLRGLGGFGSTVGDMEFAAADIDIFRVGKHHDTLLQGAAREWCGAVQGS